MQTKLLPYIVIGILVIAGVVGASYYYFVIKKPAETPLLPPPAEQPAQPPAEAPSEEVLVDETANWKTYTNTKFGYSFKLPKHWYGLFGQDNETRIQTFENYDSNLITPTYSPEDRIHLEVFVYPKDYSDYNYQLNSFNKWKTKEIGFEEDQSVKTADLEVGGFPSIKIHFESDNLYSDSIKIKHTDFLIGIRFRGADKAAFDANRIIFDQMLSTFRFLE